MRKKPLFILAFVVLLLGALLFWARPARQHKVTLAMTYIPNVQFAPWYVAEEKGFFREEGLEVVFDYRMDIDALQLVAQGKMDYAIAGGDQVLVARGQGIPVVYLMSLYAEFPPAVIAKAESGIKTAADLKGKTVGLPLYGTNLLAIQAILRRLALTSRRSTSSISVIPRFRPYWRARLMPWSVLPITNRSSSKQWGWRSARLTPGITFPWSVTA